MILASASPRRHALLKALGLPFTIHSPDVDETAYGAPEEIVEQLALRKASAVAEAEADAWIVAADTIVYIDGMVLGKPHSADDARDMLARLSARAHDVYTGICLMDADTRAYDLRAARTRVWFRALTRGQIDEYIDTGEYADKAGAYAIQGGARAFVERYEGSYENIIGFPTGDFLDMYERFKALI